MNKHYQTPGWVDSLLARLAPGDLEEEIRGDLYEIFLSDVANHGISHARRRYVFNALGFLAKAFFWRRSTIQTNPFIMISSYFKMARRSILAYRGTSAINIIGLVTGIAAALVIATVVQYELSFNKSHSDVERIYRVVRVSGKDMAEFRTGVSYAVPSALKEEIASLEDITSMEYFGGAYVDIMDSSGTSVAMFREEFGCVVVQPSFFDIFDFRDSDFRWLAGNPETALTEPFDVVLTESIAKKYFPDGDALGKSIRFEKFFDAKVAGVVTDFPSNCDFPFKVLISYESMKKIRSVDRMNDWMSVNDTHHVYVKLPPGVSKSEMEDRIAKVHAAHTPKDLHENRHYLLQEITEMHHDSRFGVYTRRTISRDTVLALILVGVFLLLTAAINYINLSTAQSAMRSKEIGLRKVLGSYRGNLVAQFLIETFVIVAIAAAMAIVLAQLILLQLHSLLNLPAGHFIFNDPSTVAVVAGTVILLTVFAGFYPSFIISGFNPVTALKKKFSSETPGNISLRKTLVVSQFAITQLLVVGTFIVVSQIRYFQDVDMGFDREAIITLNFPNTSLPSDFRFVETELRSQAFVEKVSLSSTLPSGAARNRNFMDIGKSDAVNPQDFVVFEYMVIDPSFIDLYRINLLAGRNLALQDSTGNILINKTLVKNLKLGTPEEAVGQTLKMSGTSVTVVGVVDDFYSNSLKEVVDNMAFVINPPAYDFCSIKINQGDKRSLADAVAGVQQVWARAFPGHIFNYGFLDDNIRTFYMQEEKYAQLFELFTAIFVVIGCLGLYGLITFAVNRKAREVAIRKVLGASMNQILLMFSSEYVLLILVSFLIAVPVAYFSVDSWLSNFARHIELDWWLFVAPGLFVLALALVIIVLKSRATAIANPVEKLKYE